MSTILGPAPCRDCGTTVWVVRRTIVFLCGAHGPHSRLCTSESMSLTVVEDDGTTHQCLTMERAFDYTTGAGASGEPNRLNVAPVSQLAPGMRASFHVGSKTT